MLVRGRPTAYGARPMLRRLRASPNILPVGFLLSTGRPAPRFALTR